jgi:signal transduction histidine kinase
MSAFLSHKSVDLLAQHRVLYFTLERFYTADEEFFPVRKDEVQGIVEMRGNRVAVHPVPGIGFKFEIHLPDLDIDS